MRAVIPVAGVGSRLRPHTFTLPKVLLNVAGKPILGHIVDSIIAAGVTEATFVVGHMSDMIREYLGAAYPGFRTDFVEQEELMGLGHAIYLSRHTLGADPVLIILGDTVFDANLAEVVKSRTTSIGVKEVSDPRRFGVAVTRNGVITRLVEKPEQPVSNLALVGLYWIMNTPLLVESLDRLVREDIRTKGEYQLTDALQLMLASGETMTTFTVEGWYDCGKPETLLSTNRALLAKKSTSRTLPGVVINPPVYLSPTATIANSIVGPNTTVGDGATIADSIVRNSIIGGGASVAASLLENSIVGSGARVQGKYKRFNVGDLSEVEFS